MKPANEYPVEGTGEKRQYRCRRCAREYRNRWGKANRERLQRQELERRLRKKYGISGHDYAVLLEAQGGCCVICGGRNGKGRGLHVDHCHDSDRVRGLLCFRCNSAIGLLDDDPARAEALAHYLRKE